MIDCRLTLMKELQTFVSDADLLNQIFSVVNEYEITERSTELTVARDRINSIFKIWTSCLVIDGLSDNSIKQYVRELNLFMLFVNKNLEEITEYDIRYYLGFEKNRDVSNVTLKNKRTYINAFFSWAVSSGYINSNPCLSVKAIKTPKQQKHEFNNVELEKLRSNCGSLRNRAIIEMLISSGVRVTELCMLDITDVDFDTNVVQIRHGKGDKARVTAITDVCAMHLKNYLNTRTDNDCALFLSNLNKRIAVRTVQGIVEVIGKNANVTNVHPHRFRRTFATKAIDKGMQIQEVQVLLGHTDVSTTTKYVNTNQTRVMNAYNRAFI